MWGSHTLGSEKRVRMETPREDMGTKMERAQRTRCCTCSRDTVEM